MGMKTQLCEHSATSSIIAFYYYVRNICLINKQVIEMNVREYFCMDFAYRLAASLTSLALQYKFMCILHLTFFYPLRPHSITHHTSTIIIFNLLLDMPLLADFTCIFLIMNLV